MGKKKVRSENYESISEFLRSVHSLHPSLSICLTTVINLRCYHSTATRKSPICSSRLPHRIFRASFWREDAIPAAKKIQHLKPPHNINPHAVLWFLRQTGIRESDIWSLYQFVVIVCVLLAIRNLVITHRVGNGYTICSLFFFSFSYFLRAFNLIAGIFCT